MLRRFSLVAGALGLAGLVPSLALAAESKTITGSATLSGDQIFDVFTVASNATLKVLQDGMAGGTGRLTIRANSIIVQKDAKIDAVGAGSVGASNADGASEGPAGGGAKGMVLGDPGGGGAFFGNGAAGTTEKVSMTCDLVATSAGGTSFFDQVTKALHVGSAGGAANTSQSTNPGAAGGGVIELIAYSVTIDGTITAAGQDSNVFSGVAAGAGAGGSVRIETVHLEGSGMISVAGGNGNHGKGVAPSVAPNNGGGGGGGLILLSLPVAATLPSSLMLDKKGGATGDCPSGGGEDGSVVQLELPGGCVDADGDGYLSSLCSTPGPVGDAGLQGGDCDDSEPNTHPGAKEVCDGKDNNCDDKSLVDEGDNLCPAGSKCEMGACVAVALPDAGPEGGVDAGSPPDHLEFGGGCDLPGGLPAEGGAVATLALGALVFSRARRRRR